MQRLTSRPHFDNAALKRLEVILDRTFADLNIDAKSPYARASREFIAAMLLSMPVEDADTDTDEVPERLVSRAKSFGMGRTPVVTTTEH